MQIYQCNANLTLKLGVNAALGKFKAAVCYPIPRDLYPTCFGTNSPSVITGHLDQVCSVNQKLGS